MRKITANAVNAFIAGQPFNQGNTTVVVKKSDNDTVKVVEMRLHDNPIAQRLSFADNKVMISHAGWPTATTKERLNGILHGMTDGRFSVYQKMGDWWIRDAKKETRHRWDGSFVEIPTI